MTKAAMIVYARNKEKFVERAVKSCLDQTEPIEILLSDQASTDRTYEIMKGMVDAYTGRHTVKLLKCPLEGRPGMAAMNGHISWLMTQTQADIVMFCSADDWNLPARSKIVLSAYEKHRPAMVNTYMNFRGPNNEDMGRTGFPVTDGFVATADVIPKMVGGSTCPAMDREFFFRMKGLKGDITSDVYFAYLATLDKGLYVSTKPGYVHVMHADANNAGLGGRERACADEQEALVLSELASYQFYNMYYHLYVKAKEIKPDWQDNHLSQEIFDYGYRWTQTRAQLIQRGIPGGFM